MSYKYNVVVVGKTGVGKSTLINYLYGAKVREAKAGRPVTERGFHPIDIQINQLPVTLFDSWGLEVGKDKEWMDELENELSKRSLYTAPKNWFHSVFYCISTGGHRVEDFDKKIIGKFLEEKYKVTVIFTKADNITVEEGESLKQELSEFKDIDTVFVCAEEKKMMNGTTTKPFGKEEIKEITLRNFWESLIIRLPARYENIIKNEIDYFIKSLYSEHVNKLSIAGLNKENVYDAILEDCRLFIKKRLNKKTRDFVIELKKTYENYSIFAKELNLETENFKFEFGEELTKAYEEDEEFHIILRDILIGKRRSTVESDLTSFINKFKSKLTHEQEKRKKEIESTLKDVSEGVLN
ncbi:GTPase domain-containing protein [Sutcliffiella cohnii]